MSLTLRSSQVQQSSIAIRPEWRFLPIPHVHLTPPLGGSRRNIATPFGVEKLEWCGYPMVKNFEDMFIRFDMIHERDRRTDTT